MRTIALAVSLFSTSILAADTPEAPTVLFEDFKAMSTGKFPSGWKARGWRHKAEQVYSIQGEDGNQFLHALDHGEDVMVAKDTSWDWKKYPIVSWRWRAKQLPKGAGENNPKINDSACGIYIVFKGGVFIPHSIKYVWSTSLPITDTDVSYKDYLKTIVLDSGTEHLNKWVHHEVNFLEHFRRFFKKADMPDILGIGVLTDANATSSVSECDYDDFHLRKEYSVPTVAGRPGITHVEGVPSGSKKLEAPATPKKK